MILCIIPARKGSRGIFGKNMVDLGGKPLLDYTMRVAEACASLDRIVLSTDMPDAIKWANDNYKRIETPFVRPRKLCGGRVTQNHVVLHAVDYLEKGGRCHIDSVVLLQPTCPFRKTNEIDEAIRLFKKRNLTSLVGVSRVMHHPSDYVYNSLSSKDRFKFVFRKSTWRQRQDFPMVWFMTGALYIVTTDFLRETGSFYSTQSHLYEMSEETMIDIDKPFDLTLARGLLSSDKSWSSVR